MNHKVINCCFIASGILFMAIYSRIIYKWPMEVIENNKFRPFQIEMLKVLVLIKDKLCLTLL